MSNNNYGIGEREIKFRAFDLLSKEIWYPQTVGRGRDTQHLMQFTGLFDKNRKEIYEGDILKESFPPGDHITRLFPQGYRYCVVRFGEYDNGKDFEDSVYGNGWYLDCIGTVVEEFMDRSEYSPRKIEVIGNIFENPELLKNTINE